MKRHGVVGFVVLSALNLILLACGSGGAVPPPVAIAYVAPSQSHSLSVINIPANKTVSTIQIGNSSSGSLTMIPSYPTGVAVTPDGSRTYITDGSTSVWIVDTGSNSVIGKIATGSTPEGIAIAPDGKRAYVTSINCGLLLCSGPGNPPQLASVEVIDTVSNSLTATITIGNTPNGQSPGVLLSGIAISPDGTRAYVSDAVGNQIWAIDTASNQVVATIPTTVSSLIGVSISPDGSRLYAASAGNPSIVDVIDTKTGHVVTIIALPGFDNPSRIAVTPDGGHVYVTGDSGHAWVVDTTTNMTVATVPISVGSPLLGIAFTPDGTRAYITCGNKDTIYVLDIMTYRILDRVPSPYPGGLAIARSR